MIMCKHNEDYKEVGFIKKKVNGDYKDVQKIYRRDEDGNYKVIFERGYGTEYDGANDFRVPAVGKNLKDYTIFGNSEQNGFPTPDSPIEPEFCGDLVSIELDEPLRAVDSENYDTIDLATKTYTKRITDEIILTGDENWRITWDTFYFTSSIYRKNDTACVGTLDSVITYNGTYLYYGYWAVQLIFHGGDRSYTVDDLKAYLKEKYLSGNPIKVWYCVADSFVETQTLSTVPDGMTGVIEGTVTQDGTPTPDNPIEPVFNGKLLPNGKYQVYKTYKIPISSGGVNLFDPKNGEQGAIGYEGNVGKGKPNGLVSDYIDVSGYSEVVLTQDRLTNTSLADQYMTIGCWDENKNWIADSRSYKYVDSGRPTETISLVKTLPSGTKYVRCGVLMNNTGDSPTTVHAMLNLGSTALPYEPYVTPTVKNIYLGQTPTTRQIKKLVLTGEENWAHDWSAFETSLNGAIPIGVDNVITVLSNCYKGYPDISAGVILGAPNGIVTKRKYYATAAIKDNRFTTTTAFKSYLAQQYAAGTPVTVWYVLATPEVGIVNEPLCRIGDYADIINLSQAGVSIPTLPDPQTTLITIPTSVPPSEIIANYKAYKRPKYPPFLTKDGKTFDTKNGQSLYLGGYE